MGSFDGRLRRIYFVSSCFEVFIERGCVIRGIESLILALGLELLGISNLTCKIRAARLLEAVESSRAIWMDSIAFRFFFSRVSFTLPSVLLSAKGGMKHFEMGLH